MTFEVNDRAQSVIYRIPRTGLEVSLQVQVEF